MVAIVTWMDECEWGSRKQSIAGVAWVRQTTRTLPLHQVHGVDHTDQELARPRGRLPPRRSNRFLWIFMLPCAAGQPPDLIPPRWDRGRSTHVDDVSWMMPAIAQRE